MPPRFAATLLVPARSTPGLAKLLDRPKLWQSPIVSYLPKSANLLPPTTGESSHCRVLGTQWQPVLGEQVRLAPIFEKKRWA